MDFLSNLTTVQKGGLAVIVILLIAFLLYKQRQAKEAGAAKSAPRGKAGKAGRGGLRTGRAKQADGDGGPEPRAAGRMVPRLPAAGFEDGVTGEASEHLSAGDEVHDETLETHPAEPVASASFEAAPFTLSEEPVSEPGWPSPGEVWSAPLAAEGRGPELATNGSFDHDPAIALLSEGEGKGDELPSWDTGDGEDFDPALGWTGTDTTAMVDIPVEAPPAWDPVEDWTGGADETWAAPSPAEPAGAPAAELTHEPHDEPVVEAEPAPEPEPVPVPEAHEEELFVPEPEAFVPDPFEPEAEAAHAEPEGFVPDAVEPGVEPAHVEAEGHDAPVAWEPPDLDAATWHERAEEPAETSWPEVEPAPAVPAVAPVVSDISDWQPMVDPVDEVPAPAEPFAAADSEPEAVLEAEPVAAFEPEPVVEAEPEPEVAPEPVAAFEPEPVVEAEPEPEVEPEPEAAVEPEPVVEAEPEPEVAPEPVAAFEPEPVVEAEPEPAAEDRLPDPVARWAALPTAGRTAADPMASWSRLQPGTRIVREHVPAPVAAAPPAQVEAIPAPPAAAWWDVPVPDTDPRRGRFALGGYAVEAGHVVVSGVSFRPGLEGGPVHWVVGPVVGAVAPGTLVLEVDGALNCLPHDLAVLTDAGFEPTPEGFSLQLRAAAPGPFAASGTYTIR